MHSILSLLSGAVLVVLVYGLSFFPTATLAPIEEVEEAMSRTDEEEISPDVEDAEAPPPFRTGPVARTEPVTSR